jgi:N utilization substance protein B
MASNRHLARIVALQTLYEYDFRLRSNDPDISLDDLIERHLGRYKNTIEDIAFADELIKGAIAKIDDLDEQISPLAPDWPLPQISRIDHAILRIALYEMIYMKDKKIPPKVTINEAVELAKSFGSDNSSKFINGVLGSAWRKIDPENAKLSQKSPAKKDEEGKV